MAKKEFTPDYTSPHCVMTAEDIWRYCNGHFALVKIHSGMKSGEIKNCRQLGTTAQATYIVQRKYVDEWLDRVFIATKPIKALGYDITPVSFLQKQIGAQQ